MSCGFMAYFYKYWLKSCVQNYHMLIHVHARTGLQGRNKSIIISIFFRADNDPHICHLSLCEERDDTNFRWQTQYRKRASQLGLRKLKPQDHLLQVTKAEDVPRISCTHGKCQTFLCSYKQIWRPKTVHKRNQSKYVLIMYGCITGQLHLGQLATHPSQPDTQRD